MNGLSNIADKHYHHHHQKKKKRGGGADGGLICVQLKVLARNSTNNKAWD